MMKGDTEKKGYGLLGRFAYVIVDLGFKFSTLPLVGRIGGLVAAGWRHKVVTIPVDTVIRRDPAIFPCDAARALIEASSCAIVVNTCLCREGHGCKDYPTDLGCLFLGRGAERIKLGGRTRPISKADAIGHIERAKARGLIINAIWSTPEMAVIGGDPASTLELCSCCPCCCIAFKAKDVSKAFLDCIAGFGISRVVKPGDDCIRCHRCTAACPFDAIRIDAAGGPSIDPGRCKGCGRCETACSQGVLKIAPLDSADTVLGTKYFEEFLAMVR